MSKSGKNNDTNNSIGNSPKKWNWYKSLWKYKYEIAAAVVVTGVVLGFVVATHGVGALAVGVVAANYAPAAIAGLTLGSVGIAGLAGFALNKAGKSSNSKSQFNLPDFWKKVLGTDDKTKNLAKILKQEGLKVDDRVLGQLIATDKNNKLYHDEGNNRVEVRNSKYIGLIVTEYTKLLNSQQHNFANETRFGLSFSQRIAAKP
jgi:hypothetical protein